MEASCHGKIKFVESRMAKVINWIRSNTTAVVLVAFSSPTPTQVKSRPTGDELMTLRYVRVLNRRKTGFLSTWILRLRYSQVV